MVHPGSPFLAAAHQHITFESSMAEMADNTMKAAEIRLEEASQAREILARYEGDACKKVLRKVCFKTILHETFTQNSL